MHERATYAAETAAGVSLLEEGLRVASHEIRQPVAAVLAIAEAAKQAPGVTSQMREYLDRIIDQASSIAETARVLLDAENHREPELGIVAIDDVVRSALDAFRLTWSGDLDVTGVKGMVVVGDRAALLRCVVNVLANATRAAGPSGRVVLDVSCDGGSLLLAVEDDGPGFGRIASQSRIGLALTRIVLTSVDGSLSTEGTGRLGGARVVLRIPRPSQSAGLHVRQAG